MIGAAAGLDAVACLRPYTVHERNAPSLDSENGSLDGVVVIIDTSWSSLLSDEEKSYESFGCLMRGCQRTVCNETVARRPSKHLHRHPTTGGCRLSLRIAMGGSCGDEVLGTCRPELSEALSLHPAYGAASQFPASRSATIHFRVFLVRLSRA